MCVCVCVCVYFVSLGFQVNLNERAWRNWFDQSAPEDATLPDGYQDLLDTFRKLLLIRSWCPDRTIAQVGARYNPVQTEP